MLRNIILAGIVIMTAATAWSGEATETKAIETGKGKTTQTKADETVKATEKPAAEPEQQQPVRSEPRSVVSARTAQLEIADMDEQTKRIILRRAAKRRTTLGPLGRGLHGAWNMAIAPLEVPATVLNEMSSQDNAIKGVLWGGFGGLGNFAVREIAGMAEVVTTFSFKRSQPLYDRSLGEPAEIAEPWE